LKLKRSLTGYKPERNENTTGDDFKLTPVDAVDSDDAGKTQRKSFQYGADGVP